MVILALTAVGVLKDVDLAVLAQSWFDVDIVGSDYRIVIFNFGVRHVEL